MEIQKKPRIAKAILRKNIKISRDGEIGEHKLDEMGTLNMK